MKGIPNRRNYSVSPFFLHGKKGQYRKHLA